MQSPPIPAAFDEMRDGDGRVRSHYRELERWLAGMPAGLIAEKRAEADLLFRRVGITFAVYCEEAGAERLIPLTWCRASSPRPSGASCSRGSSSA